MDKDDVNNDQNLNEWLNQVHYGSCCSDEEDEGFKSLDSETEETQEPDDSQ